jgi:hypothetical protein
MLDAFRGLLLQQFRLSSYCLSKSCQLPFLSIYVNPKRKSIMDSAPLLFTKLYAADWARDEGNRVCARVDVDKRTVTFVDNMRLTFASLLDLVRRESTGRSLLSFDLAIGIPAELRFSDGEPTNSFLDWIKHHSNNNDFWRETKDSEIWSTSKPFISVPAGNGALTKFTDKAGCNLKRSFDKQFQGKSPLIVSGIPGTVGSATRSFWRELVEFLGAERDFSIWPFEGSFEDISEMSQIVVCENYPAISYTGVFAREFPSPRIRINKTIKESRIEAIESLDNIEWLQRCEVRLPNLECCIESEDYFDALMVGLAKLRCVLEAPHLLEESRENKLLEGDIVCSGVIDKNRPSITLNRYFQGRANSVQARSAAQKIVMPLKVPVLGLDLDGVITNATEFFSAWTNSWPGKVIITTYRRDRTQAIADLQERNIRFDEVVLVEHFEAKAEVIAKYGVTMYVDDQPEMLRHIPEGINVMLFHNRCNYDFGE